ncbi:MAG: protein kinase [Acidobacteria bacterium]|nr:protein kinase [Acidobacteriota bacterium]MCW5949072.1 protein kinase [Pyrinomonadaceae bacterium]
MRVSLNVIAGPQTGRKFVFDQHDTFMIGRSEDAHFCLSQDRFFSRHHCLIEIAPPQAFLRDLGSTNGTFVNGIRVDAAHLKSGDRIQGGETVLELIVSADSGSHAGAVLGEQTQPSLVSVTCLNCSSPATAETSASSDQLTYICDECREKLKQNPQPIPGYQMIRVIGQGGMGSVMLARSERDGRAVAIKTLLPEVAVSEQSVKRFMREIEVAASLKHPHIVEYIEHGTHNGMVFLVTEFVNGMDASRLAKHRNGKLPWQEAVQIISQMLEALDHAHSLGFVHRDIKEQNILVAGSFPNATAKLTDFGLSKSYVQTGMSGVTMVGDVAGTIAYMPPEQVKDFKEVKPPSDIYSVGMTAYSMITGAHPLDIGPKAGISETVKAIFEKPIIPIHSRISDVPVNVGAVIETALAKQPELRWRSAGAMREALNNAARSG